MVVGVNEFANQQEKLELDLLLVDPAVEAAQQAKLQKLRQTRDNLRIGQVLADLQEVAAGGNNLMSAIIECVKAYATLGEITGALRKVFGEYREKPLF